MKSTHRLTRLLTFLILAATVLLLLWRFHIAMTRFFDVDEFTHMFRSYLIATGEIPYKDFGYFYSPLFPALFSPFFLKQSLSALFLSRSLEFLIFAFTIPVAYFIGKTLSGSLAGALSAFLLVSLPAILDKTIEIRPDNLALLFWLISFLFLLLAARSRRPRLTIFTSGLFFGLAFLTLIKIGFAYPGLIIYLFFLSKNSRQNLLSSLLFFHLGALLPLLLFFLLFLLLGTLPAAFYSVFIMPLEISQAYGAQYFVPFFPFYPNDTFYGVGGISLPWAASNLILLAGIIGLFRIRPRSFFLVSFAAFLFSLLLVYKLTLMQYYLPLLILLILSAAQLLGTLILRFLPRLPYLVFSLAFAGLFLTAFSFWQSATVHFNWTNHWQIDQIDRLLSLSQPGDYFYDMVGYHLFRPSGYYLCCEFFADWSRRLSRPLPSFQEEMEGHHTKFIYQTDRLVRLFPEDSEYIKTHFVPSAVENILVRR